MNPLEGFEPNAFNWMHRAYDFTTGFPMEASQQQLQNPGGNWYEAPGYMQPPQFHPHTANEYQHTHPYTGAPFPSFHDVQIVHVEPPVQVNETPTLDFVNPTVRTHIKREVKEEPRSPPSSPSEHIHTTQTHDVSQLQMPIHQPMPNFNQPYWSAPGQTQYGNWNVSGLNFLPNFHTPHPAPQKGIRMADSTTFSSTQTTRRFRQRRITREEKSFFLAHVDEKDFTIKRSDAVQRLLRRMERSREWTEFEDYFTKERTTMQFTQLAGHYRNNRSYYNQLMDV